MSGPITTHHGKPPAFAWSYSKLKNYETCPKRHFHYDVAKDVKEPESEQLRDGNFVHDVLHKRLGKDKVALPPQVSELEKWAVRVESGPGLLLVEQKLAIRRDFTKCNFFGDRTVWYRGIGDVIKINGPVGLIIDWKTGKIVEDSVQLMLMAQCVFSHYPEVQKVRSEFVWLKEDATTRQDFARADMPAHWNSLMPRLNTLEHATVNSIYPAKPGFLCKRWCAVTACPHHGE